jgi:hypothetical protein
MTNITGIGLTNILFMARINHAIQVLRFLIITHMSGTIVSAVFLIIAISMAGEHRLIR